MVVRPKAEFARGFGPEMETEFPGEFGDGKTVGDAGGLVDVVFAAD